MRERKLNKLRKKNFIKQMEMYKNDFLNGDLPCVYYNYANTEMEKYRLSKKRLRRTLYAKVKGVVLSLEKYFY